MEIKTPIEWNDFAEDFLDADGNIFRADQIATALNLATERERRLVEALGLAVGFFDGIIRLHEAKVELEVFKEIVTNEALDPLNDVAKIRAIHNALAEHKGEK